jgi:benzoyl-CoA reductase/2-hydroxyglutaryl-CoA dehydratase subunit BcrC/BadD/HgdB
MNPIIEPLINDEYTGLPLKRILDRLLAKRDKGRFGVGVYCGYAPAELIRAQGGVPIALCAFANKTIPAAENVLPANLCPLIKSSFGFIATDTCPFFALSQAIIGETTCDGKKKMFELIAEKRPLHVMDLPSISSNPEAVHHWVAMIGHLRAFLEATFQRPIADADIEAEIQETNRKNRLMQQFFAYAATHPPVVSWSEMYDVIAMANISSSTELRAFLDPVFEKLESRKAQGIHFGMPRSPRVMVGGCPLGGDSTKVFRVLEQAGGVVVALEACSGMKVFTMQIDEQTGEPIAALARAYLAIPCSCMSPNKNRFDALERLRVQYQPDVMVDVVLQACHTYNIESYRVKQWAEKQGLGFLKIETDYSDSDLERIRTRVEALYESLSN